MKREKKKRLKDIEKERRVSLYFPFRKASNKVLIKWQNFSQPAKNIPTGSNYAKNDVNQHMYVKKG